MKRKAVGILPNPQWLITNGYNGLYQVMRKHPETFAHIQQESKKGRTPEEWLPEAERLTKEHGILPSPRWLRTHGYAALNAMMGKRPEAFAHIRQEKQLRQTLAEHIETAERLRRRQGNLPNPQWLVSHGYGGLCGAMQAYPHAFAHIPQNRKFKSLADHVRDAKRLGEEHGKLPGPRWLINHDFRGLYRAILKHPGAFRHVPRGWRPNKSLADHVQDAERLERKHGKLAESAMACDPRLQESRRHHATAS